MPAMKWLKLPLSLAFFVPAFALLGGFASLDSGAHPAVPMTLGGLIGVFFGLVFSGVRFRWLDRLLGPERSDDDG